MSFCPACRSEYPDDWKRCPKDEAELLSSQYIGKYRIDALIGAGGMGAVYKAFNPGTKAPVAIKLMHPEASAIDTARARFQREAAAISALRTQHLVTIYDFGAEADGTLYLVMEYLIGHTLRAEITPPPNTMHIGRMNLILHGSLRGLGSAHKTGIVHRDLKPENIFIADTEDGEVAKVLDFGIAQVQSAQQQSALTQEGALMGTPAYMAPEQVAGSRGEMGPHTDVYAMGVIAYEMLTGETPFAGDSITTVFSRVLSREFTPLQSLRPDLPPQILHCISTAMMDAIPDRYRDANQFREAWRAAYQALPAAVRDATIPNFSAAAAGKGKVDALSDTAMPGLGTAPTQTPDPSLNQPAPVGAHPDSQRSIGPVVVNTGGQPAPTPAKPSKKGLWIGLAVAAVAGGGIAFAVLGGGGGDNKKKKEIARATIDAGTAVSKPPVATADAAPAKVDPPPKPTIPKNMVAIEGGTFEMRGKKIKVASFLIDKHEVTVRRFKRAAKRAGLDVTINPRWRPMQPMRKISWTEAAAACKAMGRRLPSEAEWEYAATRSELDPNGARLRGHRRVKGPARVGTHRGDCTTQGVCDMLGNVMEWVADSWKKADGSIESESLKTIRGASFTVAPAARNYATVMARLKLARDKRDKEVGFRCARNVDGK
jgi:serine/threonine-protein kinase